MKHPNELNWVERHKNPVIVASIAFWLVVILVVGVAIGNSNSGHPTSPNNSDAGSASNSTNAGSDTIPASSTAKTTQPYQVGDTITMNDIAVTLTKIIDPADGADEFTTPNAGGRFVAVDVAIQNNGGSTYSDDANSDMTLIGSDTQAYSPDFDSVSECTNFNEGEYVLAPGDQESGCVVFQLPDAVTPAKVQFSVRGGQGGEWQTQ